MEKEKKINVVILEKDSDTVQWISNILNEKSYQIIPSDKIDGAIRLIKERSIGLVILGEAEGEDSIFDTLKHIVMASPMTSVILITDLPEDEVNDRAEGYGILTSEGVQLNTDLADELQLEFDDDVLNLDWAWMNDNKRDWKDRWATEVLGE